MSSTSRQAHLSVAANGVDFEMISARVDTIHVHRVVRGLRGYVLIERVPRNALHIVVMFCYFVHTFS